MKECIHAVQERLQKLISQAGLASRRDAEELIRQGRVTINGRIAVLGDKADLDRDTVTVDGETLKVPAHFAYFLVNKPRGVVSTTQRQAHEKRRLVRELVPFEGHLFLVGRLDAESEGLVLLTNDGELANQLMHPRYRHTKTYHVLVEGRPTPQTLERWRSGVILDGQPTGRAKVRELSSTTQGTWLEIVMYEGRNRQIRRVAEILGHKVLRLIRVKIDQLEIGRLQPGQWRSLSPKEVSLLKSRKRP